MLPCAPAHDPGPGAGLHCNQNPYFALGDEAPFSALFLIPNIGIIEFNHTLERIAGIPVLHSFSDLMSPARGRWIGDA